MSAIGARDVSGVKFGRLTAVSPAKFPKWECACDCGGRKAVSIYHLVSGSTVSCGCATGRDREDLVGQVFTRLTVVRPGGGVRRSFRWECECSCGSVGVMAETSTLRSGAVKSCGCMYSDSGLKRTLDMTGQKFGRFTVLSKSETRGAGRQVKWECECECGNTRTILGASLRSGATVSCGCFQREMMKQRNAAKRLAAYLDETYGPLDA